MGNFSGAKLMLFSQGNVQANGSDPLTFDFLAASGDLLSRLARRTLRHHRRSHEQRLLLRRCGDYDEETTDNRRWFDEYDNAGAGVGYLGEPVCGSAGEPQKSAWNNGVWMREFASGVVLWNPKGNGTQTVDVSGLVIPSGHAGLKRIAGTQDTSVNNGLAATSVTLKDRDGVILLWTTP